MAKMKENTVDKDLLKYNISRAMKMSAQVNEDITSTLVKNATLYAYEGKKCNVSSIECKINEEDEDSKKEDNSDSEIVSLIDALYNAMKKE